MARSTPSDRERVRRKKSIDPTLDNVGGESSNEGPLEEGPFAGLIEGVDGHDDFRILGKGGNEPIQPSLFPNELFAPKGLKIFRKGISALHTIPVNKGHTLNSKRVMDAIVVLVQIHFKQLPKHQRETLRELNASPLFKVTKGDLRALAGIQSKEFGRIEDVLDLLHDMKIQWNVLGEDAAVEWKMTSRFLASYGIGLGRNEHMVCFSIDPRVLYLLLEPRLWASLNLDVQHQLGTETSYALYQHAFRYVGTVNKVTADFPVVTWIELLMGPCRYLQIDPDTGEKRVVNYSEWKKRYLLPAIERVNNVQALGHTLELIETRSGMKVRRIQFRFVAKKQAKLDLPFNWPDAVVASLHSMGFKDADLSDLAQGFTLDEVVESLARFSTANERKSAQGKTIVAPKAFLLGILGNVAEHGATRQAGMDEELLASTERQAQAERAKELAIEKQERARQDFVQHQTRRISDALLDWPDDRRQALLCEFESSTDFAKVKLLLAKKGWERGGNFGAWTILRTWLIKEKTAIIDDLLVSPEDRSFEAWLIGRLP